MRTEVKTSVLVLVLEVELKLSSNFLKLSKHVSGNSKTHIKVQHFRVKGTFYLLLVQYPYTVTAFYTFLRHPALYGDGKNYVNTL